MKRRLVTAAAVALAVGASAALAVPADEVTLNVERLYDQTYQTMRLRFSGVIASRVENEYVSVMQQKCGSTFSTAFAAATTGESGLWEVTSWAGSGIYRARWKEHLSKPSRVRLPVRILLTHFQGGRHRVVVVADSNLLGRLVELQRLAGGRWIRVRRSRLEAGGAGYIFNATFVVRTRGLRLRILVPAKTAAPCHVATPSQTFVS